MSRDKAIAELKECHTDDPEADHSAADSILCELLIALGYKDVVMEWLKVEKWYA